jgi:outer membrane protein assembly factor BamB
MSIAAGPLAAQPVLVPPPVRAIQPSARSVFPDDSVIARDALLRVRELAGVGNTAEGLRVLQSVLDSEADKVLPSAADPDVCVPVRGLAHELLLGEPALLAKYRELEGPQAELQLNRGELESVVRARFLTPAGFEAALRLAQGHYESARFNAAFLTLEELEKHPDRKGDKAKQAAALLTRVGPYIARPHVQQLVSRWRQDAGLPATEGAPAPVLPVLAATAATSLAPLPAIDTAEISVPALQAVALEPLPETGEDRSGKLAWVMPSVAGERVYLNDGAWVRCLDAATLAPRWAQRPERGAMRLLGGSDQIFGMIGYQSGLPEDVSSVTVANGVAITPGGIATGGGRMGDRRVHAFDALTGRPLWREDVSTLDSHLNETIVLGPIVVEGDIAVVALRKSNVSKRVNALYLAGLDLYTGSLRWWRLVGSVGTNPWGRVQTRPDATVLENGIVYRADEMGVIGAYRADSGMPVWVRLGAGLSRINDFQQNRFLQQTPAYQITCPVIYGESLFCVEPGRGRVIQLDRNTGAMLASRDSSALGEPKYLLIAGNQLAAVGDGRIAFVPLDEFASGKVRVTPQQSQPPIVGRACVSGDRVLVPLDGQLLFVSPNEPEQPERIDAPGMGNLVVAEVPATPAHLISADGRRVSSYMKWDRANALLEARIAKSPTDPDPLLTSIKLLKRAGKPEAVPALADRVLKLLDADATSTRSLALRGRLFDLLLGMIRDAAIAVNGQPAPDPAPTDATPSAISQPPASVDLAQLDAVAQRLERCAESPDQLAALAFQVAWLREAQSRPDAAIEAYQRVLLDPALGALRPTWLTSDEDGSSANPLAADEAARRLRRVLRKAGAKAYAAFDEEAATQFRSAAGASPDDLLVLARRYPAASVTPEIYLAAAEALVKRRDVPAARRALGAGVAAAELSASIGRSDDGAGLSRLVGALVAASPDLAQQGTLYRSLLKLAKERPSLTVAVGGTPQPIDSVVKSIRAGLAARLPLPAIGPEVSPVAQAIEGWEPLEGLLRTSAGLSCDTLMMYSETRQEVALWGVRAEDNQLRPIWYRGVRVRPSVLRVGPDTTLMFWPSPRGGSIESIDLDGASLWRTDDLNALFGPGADPNERIPTPMDGQVRPDDLLFTIAGDTLCLVQRSGKTAGISLTSGTTLWNRTVPASRVYEVASVGGCVLVAGSMHQDNPNGSWVAYLGAIDPVTGETKSTIQAASLGDHVRWIRALPGGDALVGTSDGLVRFEPASGTIRWSVPDGVIRTTISAWVLTRSAYVLDGDVVLHHVDLATGKRTPMQQETRAKLTLPVVASPTPGTLALGSTRGMIVMNDEGKVVGVDALDDQTRIEPPAIGQDYAVAIEPPDRELGNSDTDTFVARLYIMERPSGKLAAVERVRLYDVPRSISLLDGKIVLGQGAVTIVLDAGGEAPKPGVTK